MATILKNTENTGSEYILLDSDSTLSRTETQTSIIRWINTGTQSYEILAGPTPANISNNNWRAPQGVTSVEVLVVAGGGGGGDTEGGGGGAGGLLYRNNFLVAPGTDYSITVGLGGASRTNGSNSIFGSLTAIGGGTGGQVNANNAASGGSGGGGGRTSSVRCNGGSGTAGQGNDGGTSREDGPGYPSSGGGGAGSAGSWGTGFGSGGQGGSGGAGLSFDIEGSIKWYAGGGGGGAGTNVGNPSAGSGGIGGGGAGGPGFTNGYAGAQHTGGGGGAAGQQSGGVGGTGGSGIVVLRYTSQIDNSDPRGTIRFNNTINDIEIYEPQDAWSSTSTLQNLAGHNLHLYSEELSNSYWTSAGANMSVTNNVAYAPNGTLTADAVIPNTGTGGRYLYSSSTYTKTANVPQTTTVYAKRVNYDYITVQGSDNTAGSGIQQGFNLATGQLGLTTVQGSGVFISASMINVGNGWYRCVLVAKSPGTVARTAIGVGGNGTLNMTGDNSSYNLIWGVQVEDGVTIPGAYTRTVDVTAPKPSTIDGYTYHTYTSVGTSSFAPAVTGNIELLVVAGGGGGGANHGGAGGAGGVIYIPSYQVVAGKIYPVTVGAGGNQGSNYINVPGFNGSDSRFGNIVAVGGGGGGNRHDQTDGRTIHHGRNGGSGGGGGGMGSDDTPGNSGGRGGAGTEGQGFHGGTASYHAGAGGGGAGSPGQTTNGSVGGNTSTTRSGNGGIGRYFPQFTHAGYPAGWYGGGGGGGSWVGTGQGWIGIGGLGGGGSGRDNVYGYGVNGVANTGGGGGGANGGGNTNGGVGGSGIVIVRYVYA